jgi:hypothetical protein
VFWVEAFENGCAQGCLASTYSGPNGAWSIQNAGANSALANQWFISCQENGNPAGACGAGCGNDESLHVANVAGSPSGLLCPSGDCGAAYDAGTGVTTDRRAVSPLIDASSYTDLVLDFDLLGAGVAGSDFAQLEVSLDGGSSWQAVAVPGGMSGLCCCSELDCLFGSCCPPQAATCGGFAQGKWGHRTVSLPEGASLNSNLRIAFRWRNNSDNVGTDPSVALDDVKLTGAPSACP